MAYAKGMAALGVRLQTKESPMVTLDILDQAIQPITIESGITNQTTKLHAAVCEMLRTEGVWPSCREGFAWDDLGSVERVKLCRMFLRSMLFVEAGKGLHNFEELEVAWGVKAKKAKGSTARNSMKKYVAKALKEELKEKYSKESFPENISYTTLRRKLRDLNGGYIYI
jgi:hypothetical protein